VLAAFKIAGAAGPSGSRPPPLALWWFTHSSSLCCQIFLIESLVEQSDIDIQQKTTGAGFVI
jgi:hypothetical protein